MIDSIKNYNINCNKPFRAQKLIEKKKRRYQLDFSGFDPTTDTIDQMLLYQITGKRPSGLDYHFTLSSDEFRRSSNNRKDKRRHKSVFRHGTRSVNVDEDLEAEISSLGEIEN